MRSQAKASGLSLPLDLTKDLDGYVNPELPSMCLSLWVFNRQQLQNLMLRKSGEFRLEGSTLDDFDPDQYVAVAFQKRLCPEI